MGSDLCKMLAVMLFVGCVPTVEPQQHSFDPSFVVMATEADTWDAVVDVFGDVAGRSLRWIGRAGLWSPIGCRYITVHRGWTAAATNGRRIVRGTFQHAHTA